MGNTYSYINIEGFRRNIDLEFADFGGDYLDNYVYDLNMVCDYGGRKWIKLCEGTAVPGCDSTWGMLIPGRLSNIVPEGSVTVVVESPNPDNFTVAYGTVTGVYSYISADGFAVRVDADALVNAGTWAPDSVYTPPEFVSAGSTLFLSLGSSFDYPPSYTPNGLWSQMVQVSVPTYPGNDFPPIVPPTNTLDVNTLYVFHDGNSQTKQVMGSALNNRGIFDQDQSYDLYDVVSYGTAMYVAYVPISPGSIIPGPGWSTLAVVVIYGGGSGDLPPPQAVLKGIMGGNNLGHGVPVFVKTVVQTMEFATLVGTAVSITTDGTQVYIDASSLASEILEESHRALLAEGTNAYTIAIEQGSRIAAVSSLYTDITIEQGSRLASDAILNQGILNQASALLVEAGTRYSVDSNILFQIGTVTSAIAAETANRENDITGVYESLFYELGTLLSMVNAEAVLRSVGDSKLETEIGTLNTVVAQIDYAAGTNLDTLETEISSVSAAVTAETGRAESQEALLAMSIGTETMRATNAESEAMIAATNALNAANDAVFIAEGVIGTLIGGAPDPFTNINSVAAAIGYDPHFNITVGSQISAAVAAIVGFPPEVLDTIQELAAAMGNDPNFYNDVVGVLNTKLGTNGGTLTGDLYLYEEPWAPLQPVPKITLDNAVAVLSGTMLQFQAELVANDNANAAAITSESIRAQGVESGLLAEVGTLTSGLSAETTRATTAEATLQANIDTEATDRVIYVRDSVNLETRRAQAAEGTNASALSTEEVRALTAEGTLAYNAQNGVTVSGSGLTVTNGFYPLYGILNGLPEYSGDGGAVYWVNLDASAQSVLGVANAWFIVPRSIFRHGYVSIDQVTSPDQTTAWQGFTYVGSVFTLIPDYDPVPTVTITTLGVESARAIAAETAETARAESVELTLAPFTYVDNADSQLQVEVGTLNSLMVSEALTRSSEDSKLEFEVGTLNSLMASESSARSDGYSALQFEIGTLNIGILSESTTREGMDSALETQIGTLNANVSSESSARLLEDNYLQTEIGTLNVALVAEGSNRVSGDVYLQTEIGTINSGLASANAAIALINLNLGTYVTTAGATFLGPVILAADATNPMGAATKEQVDAVNSALGLSISGVNTSLSSLINTETANRINGDNALQYEIGTLNTSVINESSLRQTGDNYLQTEIGTLNVNLTSEQGSRVAADALLAPIASPTFTGNVTAPQLGSNEVALTMGTAVSINWALGMSFRGNLNANTVMSFSNAFNTGDIMVALTNSASNYTVTWPVATKWAGGSAPIQTTGVHTDIYMFIQTNGTVYGTAIQNF